MKVTNKVCKCDLVPTEKIPIHHTELLGIEIVLLDAAERVLCARCGADYYVIPDIDGLTAAVAMVRALESYKLSGADIRYLRKAAGYSGANLAQLLEVSVETVSRWENSKLVMGPSSEKLLRLIVAEKLQDHAPAVMYSADMVMDLNIRACQSAESKLVLMFHRILIRDRGQHTIKAEYEPLPEEETQVA